MKVDGIVGNQTMTSLKQAVEKENSKPTVSTPSNNKPTANTPSTNNKPVTTTDPVKTPKNTNEVDTKQKGKDILSNHFITPQRQQRQQKQPQLSDKLGIFYAANYI